MIKVKYKTINKNKIREKINISQYIKNSSSSSLFCILPKRLKRNKEGLKDTCSQDFTISLIFD